MSIAQWTDADSSQSQQIWSAYRQCHDVSEKAGQTAGIEPKSGSIWFGTSIQDVVAQRDAEGNTNPLFFVRVGSETYYRKGRSR